MIKTEEGKSHGIKTYFNAERSGINLEAALQPALYCAAACLLGRVHIMGDISPAAIAFCWAFAGKGAVFYPVCLFSLLGYISNGAAGGIEVYIPAMIILVILGFVFERRIEKAARLIKALVPALCIILGLVASYFISGTNEGIAVKTIIQGAVCAGLTFVFKELSDMLFSGIKTPLQVSQRGAFMVMLSLIIASLKDLPFLGFDMMTAIGIFAVLFFGFYLPSVSAEFGIILAFALFLCGNCGGAFISSICLSALLCGIFGKKGKTACLMSLAAGSILSVFYVSMESSISTAVSSVAGAFVFMIFPDSLAVNLKKLVNNENENSAQYIENARAVFESQSSSFANAFRSLAEAFEPERELLTDTMRRKNDAVIDDAADKVCRDCAMSAYCWNVKGCDTFSGFYSLIGQCDKNGSADESSMPEDFKIYCIKPKKLCEAVNNSFRVIKNSAIWQSRLLKSRSIISEQLYSVASIVESMGRAIDTEDIKTMDYADKIKERLLQEGIPAENVYVLKEPTGRMTVEIKRGKCPFGNNGCISSLIPAVNAVCGRSFIKSRAVCSKDGSPCSITLRQTDNFGFKYAASSQTSFESEISGDSFLVEENEKGVLTVAVSDGMGTGKAAQEESAKAMELLGKFSSAGFDAGLSAGILNTVLLGRGNGELFTTLDVCCINMYTGKGKLIKNGGSTAFIIRDKRVTAVRSTSLPIGIVGGIESDITEFDLNGGDMLLMVTDGIADTFLGEKDEEFIERVIRKIRRSDCEAVADAVIEEAKLAQGGKCRDDMLAVCVKIFEKH